MATIELPRGHVLSLPPELLSMIISHLRARELPHFGYARVAPYAAVCRQWQPIVERFSFREVKKMPSTDLDTFADVFRYQHRRDALQVLSMVTILPDYSKRARRRLERAEDKAANNQALTDAVRRLFEILAAWDEGRELGAANLSRLDLHLDGAAAPMDSYNEPEGGPFDQEARTLGGLRYRHSYLRLVGLGENPLPRVPRITSLSVGFRWKRRVEAASAVAITKCLPRLQKLYLDLSDNEWRYPAMRHHRRYKFAQALNALRLSGPALTIFALDLLMANTFTALRALVRSSPTTDHLCLALNAVSQLPTLKVFRVGLDSDFVPSPSLFWPDDDVTAIKPDSPFWPSLEVMIIHTNSCTPTGGWYCEPRPIGPLPRPSRADSETSHTYSDASGADSGSSDADPNSSDADPDSSDADPEDSPVRPDSDADSGNDSEDSPVRPDSDADSGSDSEDPLDSSYPVPNPVDGELFFNGQWHDTEFRSVLSPVTFNPLALSFARAVTRMPKLQRFQFQFSDLAQEQGKVNAEWDRAGNPSWEYTITGRDNEDKHRWTFALRNNVRWEVPDELMEILREGVGEEGIVKVDCVTCGPPL
ncbi:hypothetical protein BDZ91DRAFT_853066 [Kalaharituber pfeilii]|nr:hypothetical protein BDZ91DRAFT_853066 [Kalaharituber pfeilii]